jgi:integrase
VDKPDGGQFVGREERVAQGVSVRKDSTGNGLGLRIAFLFRGIECRERLDLEPTPQNIRYAVRLRGEILNAIGRRTFNYADHFPDSPRAKLFGFVPSDKLIGTLLDEHKALTRPTVEASTWLGYEKIIERRLRPWFGDVRVVDLGPSLIREKLLASGVSLKTARNIVSPLNVALDRAVNDGELAANPLDRVKLDAVWPKERRSTDWEADPFAFEEMGAIFGACRDDEEADYWRCAFGTGFRPSEQIALGWPRCDLIARAVRVEVAEVQGIDGMVLKGPKTDAGKRVVPLTRGAWEALERQWARTGAAGGRVFLDGRYGAPWRGEQPLRKRFERILRKADVRYRNPYQTRHTFASVLLAAGHPPLKVAKWMGHETTEMLDRHYGRWIEQGANPDTRAALEAFFSHPSPTAGQVVSFPR